jgi:hypothetical protein
MRIDNCMIVRRCPAAHGDPTKTRLAVVAAAWANGEHEKIAAYCRDDVETVRAIYQRFEVVGY